MLGDVRFGDIRYGEARFARTILEEERRQQTDCRAEQDVKSRRSRKQ